VRHAFALRARRALGDAFSVGAAYRFYLDDWGVISHTALADLAWLPAEHSMLGLSYRFYTQGAADHYRLHYVSLGDGLYTNDKELSPLTEHRMALQAEQSFELGDGESLRVVLSVAPSIYQYSDFVLSQITALEVSLATVFTL